MWILLAYHIQRHMNFVKLVKKSQKLVSITKRNMMPLNFILEIEIFDCWGIDIICHEYLNKKVPGHTS